MFKELIRRLKSLDQKKIEIYAEGNYPKGLEVQKVAKWQNDGTIGEGGYVTPAHFVEDAERRKRAWKTSAYKAAELFLDNGIEYYLEQLGLEAAFDIGKACNRIDTGQLKRSFTYKIKDEP